MSREISYQRSAVGYQLSASYHLYSLWMGQLVIRILLCLPLSLLALNPFAFQG